MKRISYSDSNLVGGLEWGNLAVVSLPSVARPSAGSVHALDPCGSAAPRWLHRVRLGQSVVQLPEPPEYRELWIRRVALVDFWIDMVAGTACVIELPGRSSCFATDLQEAGS